MSSENAASLTEIKNFCRKFYGPTKNLLITPYQYSVSFASLAAGATASNTIQIAANADFVCMAFLFRQTSQTNKSVHNENMPLIRLLVSDTGSNEQLANITQDYTMFCSQFGMQRTLAYPRIFSGRSSVNIAASSYESVTAYTFDFIMDGVLVRAFQG